MNDIAVRLDQIREGIRLAALKAGRSPDEISFLAVSKTVEPERVAEAFRAGVRAFGENRVQNLLSKKSDPVLAKLPIQWHMIGHLQTNKVKQVIGEVSLIHSLDSVDLAVEIDRQASARGIRYVDCLIQVNSSGEETKHGFELDGVADLIPLMKKSRIRIRGLMTIGPLTEDQEKIRASFRAVRNLRDELQQKFSGYDWSILSMGMSGDYEIAIEEGATLLRIGSAVFGPRPAKGE